MHIPDGMLSTPVVATTGATAAGFVAYAVSWTRRYLDERRIVLMAVMAALVFALQMLNFPVAGGTSGHFAGGAAAAIVLGPWPAVIVLTTVLAVQALVFADGGVLALGANILNIGVVAPFVGYLVWRVATRWRETRPVAIGGAFVAAWAACVLSALMAGLEIWLSGNARFGLVMSAMGFWHSLIGIGEGLITAGLVAYLLSVRPDLVTARASDSTRSLRGVVVALGCIALAAAGLSFMASGNPDGLEFVYFEQGIGRAFGEVNLVNTPLRDYAMSGISSELVAGVLAGVVGVIVTGVFLFVAASALRRRRHGE